MNDTNENKPFFDGEPEDPNENEEASPVQSSEDDMNDPLEVVIEEEQNEKEEENTQDDMFNDDELDLDPTLDRDEW